MNQQNTDTILMVRPIGFRYNEQTATNNYYQRELKNLTPEQVQHKALQEFDTFVDLLRKNNIIVEVIEDTLEPSTPDSIFPNNWISFHEGGTIGLYPMYAPNRRLERREDVISSISKKFTTTNTVDFTAFENEAKYLEGTGSMVLDRVNRLAYAAISERMNEEVLDEFCKKMNYQKVVFHAFQSIGEKRLPIYHTNVLMCVASNFVVICLEAIDDTDERQMVESTIKESAKSLIEITERQKAQFAGNMLEVVSTKGDKYMIMSSAAYHSLEQDQVRQIEKHCKILHSPLQTIETLGGGSARCMMAEVFLTKKI
ncbi:MAG TPA: arginine deiminase-related protein [Fulvivirga sp.]|nr:arginine deiminase-related protein [Fulvivirga sp.]